MQGVRLIMSSVLAFAIAAVGFVAPSNGADRDIRAQLDQTFSYGCSTRGSTSDPAKQQALDLRAIIASVEKDPDCQTVAPAIDALQLKYQQFDPAITALLEQKRNIAIIADLERALTDAQRAKPQDPEFISSLQQEIAQRRLQRSATIQDKDIELLQQRIQQIGATAAATDAVFTSLESATKCSSKFGSNIATSIGSQILELSSGFAAGISGSAILATGQMLGRLVQYVQNTKTDRDLRDLDVSIDGDNVGCTLESLATTYCQISDRQSVNINFDQTMCDPQYSGMWATIRHFDSYKTFTQSLISGGGEPRTVGEAGEVAAIRKYESALRDLVTMAKAMRLQTEKKLGKAAPKDQDAVLVEMLNDLAEEVYDGYPPSYIAQKFPEDPDCGIWIQIRTAGTKKSCSGDVTNSSGTSVCPQKCKNDVIGVSLPSPSQIEAISKEIARELSDYVRTKFDQPLSSPERVLDLMGADPAKNSAPIDYLNGVRSYLGTLLNSSDGYLAVRGAGDGSSQRVKMVQTAYDRVDKAIKVYEDPKLSAEEKLTALKETLLRDGFDDDISDEVRKWINDDLSFQASRQGTHFTPALSTVIQLAGSDTVSKFEGLFSDQQNEELQQTRAKELSEKSLKTSGVAYGDVIQNYIEQLSRDTTTSDPESQKTSRDALALNCVRALLVPFEKGSPKFDSNATTGWWTPDFVAGGYDLRERCKGAVYQSPRYNPDQPNAKLRLSFDELSNKHFSERACALYDFLRTDRIEKALRPPRGNR